MEIDWNRWVQGALRLGLGCALSGCAAEGALANAMIVQGDAEGSLVKTTAEGLPVCDATRDGAVFYLAPSDELVFCAGGTYQTLGEGVCDAPVDSPDPKAEGGVADAGEPVACTLVRTADGMGRVTCDDGSRGQLMPVVDAGEVDSGAAASIGQYD